MGRPSIFQQLPGSVQVMPDDLLPSPRHWNSGIIRVGGNLYLAYRHHRQTQDARCAIAICKLNPKTLQPVGKSQLLDLGGPTGAEHHEDPRLFIFQGKPHLSYTEMRGYRPGIDYNCVMKYAELKFGPKDKCSIVKIYHPKYGNNQGFSKEKNWVFFEHANELYCIYEGSPRHLVLKIDKGVVKEEYISSTPVWPWGPIRGGANPVKVGDVFVHVFHSSLPTEDAPHYVRYYAGAYTFDAKPPFKPLKVSMRPFAVGSEADGHQVDPRYVEGWKPFVVFPCGALEQDGKLLVSMGVNDWQTVVSPVSMEQLQLAEADGSEHKARYFRTPNGTLPIEIMKSNPSGGESRQEWLQWEVPRPGTAQAGAGYLKVSDLRVAEEVSALRFVEEIDEAAYKAAMSDAAPFHTARWR